MSHSLTNATKGQFMAREAKYATRGSRNGANLLGWEEPEALKPEERRDCLVARAKQIQKIIVQLDKKSPERKSLGKQLFDINLKINSIRPKKRCPGIESHFIDVAREKLSKHEFDRFMGMAAERLKNDG